MSGGEQRRALAEAVREACIQAALDGYEDASISGLCGEGALEVAISTIRRLELGPLIDRAAAETGESGAR